MDPIESIVARHLAAWNLPPNDERTSAIAATYSDDVVVAEAQAKYEGHAGVDEAISNLQAALPGMMLTLSGDIQTAQEVSTYAWDLGPEGQPAVVHGRDVIFVSDGLISRVHVLINE